MTDIEKKAKDIAEGNNLSNSQLDRLVDPKILLMNYLSTHIEKLQKEDELLYALRTKFLQGIEDDTYSDGMQLKIFEILSKKQSEDNAPVMNLFAKALETKKEPVGQTPSESGNDKNVEHATTFTQEEISKSKKWLKVVDSIEKGEFNIKELLEKNKEGNK